MIFSKSDMLDRMQEVERDFYELAGHIFVRECIDLYLNGELPNIGEYDTEAILFLRDDNISYMRQKLFDIDANMRVVHRNTQQILHKLSENKTIRLVNYQKNRKNDNNCCYCK